MRTTKTENIYQNIYDLVRKIPPGKVTTYGHIASAIGNRGWSRMVGYALHGVTESDIPCHRVVNRNGELSGSTHFSTPTMMRELLEAEEIEFISCSVNLKKHLWIPE